jgi:LAO/AO transport system kinase
VINKSDRDGAERVEREIRAMQAITPMRMGAGLKDTWTPPIVKTVASNGSGIDELVATIGKYHAYLEQNDRALARRIENWRKRIAEMLRDALFQRVFSHYMSESEGLRYATEVAEHKRDPYSLVEKFVARLGTPE